MLCQECLKRDKCTSLCAKAEKYVNQDYVGPSDIPSSSIDLNIENLSADDCYSDMQELSSYFCLEITTFECLTPVQNRMACMFYLQNKTHNQIAIAMSGNNKGAYSRRAVKHQLAKVRAVLVSIFP